MSVARFFSHAVTGFRGEYPRSRMEMGLGASAGFLAALVFEESAVLLWLALGFAVSWMAFYLSALLYSIRLDAKDGDKEYQRRGKYRLSRDYWDTEGPPASKAQRSKRKP